MKYLKQINNSVINDFFKSIDMEISGKTVELKQGRIYSCYRTKISSVEHKIVEAFIKRIPSSSGFFYGNMPYNAFQVCLFCDDFNCFDNLHSVDYSDPYREFMCEKIGQQYRDDLKTYLNKEKDKGVER